MPAKYVMQPSASRCPHCQAPVVLLTPDDWRPRSPIFYICFTDRQVFQVGVGIVPKEEE